MGNFLKIVFALISIVPFAVNAQTAYDIRIHDTRNINDSPTVFNRVARFDFKIRSIVGVPGLGTYSGQLTIAPWVDNSGGRHHQLNFNDGGIFYRTGRPDEATWGSWRRLVLENASGNVGIGTRSPDEKLSVNGRIRAREVKVEIANWPDYVFKDEYNLLSLAELEDYIDVHGHLPEIPSQNEAETNGVLLGEMNVRLLEKIEELTLYIIQQGKQMTQLRKTIENKDIQYSNLEKRLLKLENQLFTR